MPLVAMNGAGHRRRIVALGVLAAAGAAGLPPMLYAQERHGGRVAPPAVDTTGRHGPAFFTIRPSDGARVDASDTPALQRRISLTLIGVPLGMAVQAIGDRAGLETTFRPEDIPLGARVSMAGDDVTVAAALRWVLVNAHVDVLLEGDRHLTLVPQASPTAVEDSSGVLAGALLDSETGEPVPYGTVTLLGTDLARFTDRTGHFRMVRLPARRYVLRARQIGYSPVDSTIGIARGATTRVTMRMHRVPAMLSLVRVTGHHGKGCVATGIPDSTVDPTLAALFTQIRENVDRYDLLLAEYPFRYLREETGEQVLARRGVVEHVDTIAYESQARRPYRVGGLIFRDSTVYQDSVFRDLAGKTWDTRARCPANGCAFMGMRPRVTERRRLMYLPTFADLVDPAFLAAHCFTYGGTTGQGAARLIRVNFEPAKRIKTPDVSGSVYLDADSLILRRAVFHMTKPEAAEPPITGFTVSSTFREILPLVPIVDSVESTQPVQGLPPALGFDRVISFAFEQATPGDQPSAPPEYPEVARAPRSDSAAESPAARLVVDPGFTRIRAVFPADSLCTPIPAVDTVSVLLYATLQGRRPRHLSDSAWSRYTTGVLSALSESFALPDTLALSTFSWPFEHAVRKAGPAPYRALASATPGEAASPAVVPRIDSSAAPSGALTVVVLDDAGHPVPLATLRLAGTSELRVTDSSGIARVGRLRPGAYLVQMGRIGYAPRDTTVVVNAGPAITTDTIRTTPVAARLAVVTVEGRNAGLFVMPMMSTVVTLTLGADGSLEGARVAASTGSRAADALVVAAARRAAAAHAFPQLQDAADHLHAISADVTVSMAEPASGDEAVALARLDAPAWPSVSAAQLVDRQAPPSDLVNVLLWGGPAADTAALEFVVDARGEALPATARFDYGSSHARQVRTDLRERYMRELVFSLRDFRFDAGRIAGCVVPEFVRQAFGYNFRSE